MKFEENHNVVILTSDKVTAVLLQNMILQLGASCDLFDNGDDLLNFIHEERQCDAILMSISIKDSYVSSPLIEKIISETQQVIPVIGLSANPDPEIIQQLRLMGFYDVLTLPPTPAIAYVTISNAINYYKNNYQTGYNDLSEYLTINYLESISKLLPYKLEEWRDLIEFSENNIRYFNSIVGSIIYAVTGEMQVARSCIVSRKWVEADTAMHSILQMLEILPKGQLPQHINGLIQALYANKDADFHAVINLFNILESAFTGWLQEIYPEFNTGTHTQLFINETAMQRQPDKPMHNALLALNTAAGNTSENDQLKQPAANYNFKRVLIIDDDEAIANIIDFRLKKDGLSTLVCNDGKAAIDALNNELFSLIITDLMMPYYNGLELISIVRNKLHLNTPILVLSAVDNEDTVVEALRIGANDFITKPFSAQELSTRVNKYLR